MSNFIDFIAKSGAVSFGDFSIGSRKAPYFVDPTAFADANTIFSLGEMFASAINQKYGSNFDAIYGPSYRGIPLAVATSIAFYKNHYTNKKWIFDVRERLVTGHTPERTFYGADKLDTGSKIVVVDYVFGTGKTKRELVQRLENALNAEVVGVIVGVDLLERWGRKPAVEEFVSETGIPVHSFANIRSVIDYMKANAPDSLNEEVYNKCVKYLKANGF